MRHSGQSYEPSNEERATFRKWGRFVAIFYGVLAVVVLLVAKTTQPTTDFSNTALAGTRPVASTPVAQFSQSESARR
jgi:hypothetical protein